MKCIICNKECKKGQKVWCLLDDFESGADEDSPLMHDWCFDNIK